MISEFDPHSQPQPQSQSQSQPQLLQFKDYRLVTVEVVYSTSEFPDLSQSFLWQGIDQLPHFPKIWNFLALWESDSANQNKSLRQSRIGYVSIINLPEDWQWKSCNMLPM